MPWRPQRLLSVSPMRVVVPARSHNKFFTSRRFFHQLVARYKQPPPRRAAAPCLSSSSPLRLLPPRRAAAPPPRRATAKSCRCDAAARRARRTRYAVGAMHRAIRGTAPHTRRRRHIREQRGAVFGIARRCAGKCYVTSNAKSKNRPFTSREKLQIPGWRLEPWVRTWSSHLPAFVCTRFATREMFRIL